MYVYVGIAVASLLIGFGGGWKTNGWRHDAAAHAASAQQQRDTLKRMDRVDEAAASHEDFKAKEGIRYVEIVKVVTKLVDRPVYRNQCLDDDGLRILRSAIRGEDSSQSSPAVPAAARP
jgi:hypothetical protein